MKRFLLSLSIFILLFCIKALAQTNQTVNAGNPTTAVTFPGGSCIYHWTNDTPGIGLPASGTGDINSFTAVNSGSSAVIATITATPVTAGFAYIPNYGDGTVSVVDLATNTVVSLINVGLSPFGVAASTDGTRVYITNQSSNSVSVINTANNTVQATVAVGSSPSSAAVSPDGTRVYVTNVGDNTVSVINTLTNSVVSTVTVGPQPLGVAVSPNGAFVYVTNSYSNTVSVIQTASNTVSTTITVGTHPFGVCFSPDGSKAYVANHDGQSVSVINTATKTVTATVVAGITPYGICSSPDGKYLYTANLDANTVSVISTASNNVISTIPVGSLPYGICANPDGSSVYVVTRGTNSVSTISTATNTVSSGTVVGSSPYSFGNFFAGISNCSSFKFTITVNPAAPGQPTVTTSPVIGSISACVGTASASPQIQQFTISGSNLIDNISATVPSFFEISTSPNSGFGSSVTLQQTGGTVNATTVYIRSNASAPVGIFTGPVSMSSVGWIAIGQGPIIRETVNALPAVNTVPDQTWNSGQTTTAVNFTGTANTFTWTNDTPGIGLAAKGTGNIASFTALNTGTTAAKATITVTPIAADLAFIVNFDRNSVSVINTISNKVISAIPVGTQPFGASATPDGTRVYITNTIDGTVSVIDVASETVISTIHVGNYPTGITTSPDGSKVYVTNVNDQTLSVINVAANVVVATIKVSAGPEGVYVSPDSKTVYVTNISTGIISVINAATNTVATSIQLFSTGVQGGAPNGITGSLDGKLLYVSKSNDGVIAVINTTSDAVVATIPVGAGPNGVAINNAGSLLYVANFDSNTVSVINTATNTVIATVNVGTYPQGISVNSDDSKVYVTNHGSGTVSVINTKTNTVSATINTASAPISVGNFIAHGTGCTGGPGQFTITVNPAAPIITTGTVTGTISACVGTASASPFIQQFTVSGSGLPGDILAAAPSVFEVSLSPTSGFGNFVTLKATGGVVNSTVVYVRSAATASAGIKSGYIDLTSGGFAGPPVPVTETINALPTVTQPGNQTVNTGAPTTAVSFTGTGNTFSWTNDTPGIGLAASGTGDIASFTAVNTGSTPVVATITATPVSAGYAYVTNDGSTVSIINTTTNQVANTITVGDVPAGVAVAPGGARVYIANRSSNNITVINTTTKLVTGSIAVSGSGPMGLVVSNSGQRLYAVDQNSNEVSVINTGSALETATIAVGSSPYGIAISPDDSRVYVTNYSSGSVSVINTASNTVIATVLVGQFPVGIVVSPDGSRVYAVNQNSNSISVIDAGTNAIISTINVGAGPTGIAISPDGSKLYTANSGAGTVSVVSTATNTVIATTTVGSGPFGISINADGSLVYVANSTSQSVSVINTATNAVVNTISTGNLSQSFGNFIQNGSGCTGAPVTFTITVKPAAAGSPNITASTATGSISACVGTASTSPNIQQFTVSGSNLPGDILAATSAIFEVSLSPNSGFGNFVTLKATGGVVNSTVVYVRSAATVSAGVKSGYVALTSGSFAGPSVPVTETINALPTVAQLGNQIVSNGAPTTAVSFTGTGNTFSWTNDTPGIGLPASGTGDIPSFTAINTGTSLIIATIKATPISSGYAFIPSYDDASVAVINTTTNTVVKTIPVGQQPIGVSVSPDGSSVYITNTIDNTVSVISTASLSVTATIHVGNYPWCICASPDGSKVYVSNTRGNSISVISTVTNNVIATIALTDIPSDLCVSPDGSRLYVTNYNNGSVWVINTATNALLPSIAVGAGANGLAISPDGSKLYVANAGVGTVSVVNTATGSVGATITVGANPYAVVVSPDGSRVYVTNNNSGSVSVIDAAANTVVATATVGSPIGISINQDGSLVYVVNGNGYSVAVINTTTNSVVSTVGVGTVPYSIGNFVASGTGCTGAPTRFTITVTPGLAVPIITTGAVSGNISACAGTASSSPNIQQFTASGNNLASDIILTASNNFEISVTPGSGYTSSLRLTQKGGIVNNTIIYVRLAASAPTGNIPGNVSLISQNTQPVQVAVTGLVNAPATINAVSPQIFADGQAVTGIVFNANGNDVSWTNDTPGIGLPASGNGNIPAFTAVNKGNIPIVAKITVTPFTPGAGCPGTPVSFTITVNPSVVTPIITVGSISGTISACVGVPSASPNIQQFTTNAINLTGDVTVTCSVGFEISLTAIGGYSNSLTISPVGGAVDNAIVYVRVAEIATAGNMPGTVFLNSNGTPVTNVVVDAEIYDLPIIGTLSNLSYASGTLVPGIVFSGGGATYSWTNDNPGIGLAASGTGNIDPFTAVNTGNADIVANITVTTISAAGCMGGPAHFTITVSPAGPLVITAAGTLSPLNTVYGTPSTSTVFSVSATGLTAGILIQPPAGFEISTDDITYSNSLTIGSGSTINGAQVYIRLAATTHVGPYSGPITLSSSGTSITDIMPSSTVIPAPLTITADNKVKAFGTANPPLTASYAGFVNGDTPADLLSAPVLATIAVTSSPIGQYPITLGGYASKDYNVIAVDGVLNVIGTIVIPNTFTPNGDGINDTWNIKYLDDYANCTVQIFNRYGQSVFSSVGYGIPWDGTYKGAELPTGTYYYVIDLKNDTKYLSGFIALLR